MRRTDSFLSRTRSQRPAAWALLKLAAARGLVRIDEDRDRVTRLAASRSRSQGPSQGPSRDVLDVLVEGWQRDAISDSGATRV